MSKTTAVVPTVEFHIRVRLPSAAGYAPCPSGDTDYESDYRDAIFAAKPEGFEVRWPRLNQKWPVDSEGYTWVPLTADQYTPDERARLLQQIHEMSDKFTRMRDKARALATE